MSSLDFCRELGSVSLFLMNFYDKNHQFYKKRAMRQVMVSWAFEGFQKIEVLVKRLKVILQGLGILNTSGNLGVHAKVTRRDIDTVMFNQTGRDMSRAIALLHDILSACPVCATHIGQEPAMQMNRRNCSFCDRDTMPAAVLKVQQDISNTCKSVKFFSTLHRNFSDPYNFDQKACQGQLSPRMILKVLKKSGHFCRHKILSGFRRDDKILSWMRENCLLGLTKCRVCIQLANYLSIKQRAYALEFPPLGSPFHPNHMKTSSPKLNWLEVVTRKSSQAIKNESSKHATDHSFLKFSTLKNRGSVGLTNSPAARVPKKDRTILVNK